MSPSRRTALRRLVAIQCSNFVAPKKGVGTPLALAVQSYRNSSYSFRSPDDQAIGAMLDRAVFGRRDTL